MKRSSKPPLGLYAEMIRSCFTAVIPTIAFNPPLPLSSADTLATINPDSISAVRIEFHTADFVLENSTVIHRPGFNNS